MFPTGGPPLSDITLKLEEISKPITFPAIKAEPDEFSHLPVCPLLEMCHQYP